MHEPARPETAAPTCVLVVDDDDLVRMAVAQVLHTAGHQTVRAVNGLHAVTLLHAGKFDAVVSDINMPNLDGMGLLQQVRKYDPDLPVILLTGDPQLETAMKAVELGALRYLVKPFNRTALEEAVADAVRLRRLARVRRELFELLGSDTLQVNDPAELEACFERAMDGLTMHFQPIVCWSEQRIFGYEALVRPNEPTLPHPGALFTAAEQLGRLRDLGRLIRARVAAEVQAAPVDSLLFVNLHTRDLMDGDLFEPSAPLSLFAGRVVLEITERAPLHEIRDIRGRTSNLRDLGYRIALDDLGAGYAGLNSFAQLEPEIVKLDLALVRNIDREPTKQKLVRSMASLCSEMGQLVVAEGVETIEERDALLSLGCDLLQGFLFARPRAGFATVGFAEIAAVS